MITVKSLSDTHGNLPVITEGFDLMLIAGDITPAEWGYGSKMVQWDWLINEFKDWIDSLPYNNIWSKVYIVPGNHDKVFEAISDAERKELEYILGPHCELLIHEEKIFSALNEDGSQTDYRIFGTPFCKVFGNWSFMVYDSVLESKFNEIPEGLDFLVTHDPPTLNGLGKITQGRSKGKQAGNEILSKRILEIKPKYVFSGHIHSGNHNFEEYEGIKMANVAYVNEYYEPWGTTDADILTFNVE